MFSKNPKLLIALDSFKGSIDAFHACKALQRGLQKGFRLKAKRDLEMILMPLSDGGEGVLEVLGQSESKPPSYIKKEAFVTAPHGEKIKATYLEGVGQKAGTAMLEMARSTGLTLVPKDSRRTLLASSYGLGEMILQAYEGGARRIILGVGGSATTDGGAGALQALGLEFYDKDQKPLPAPLKAIDLAGIESIGGRLKARDLQLEILCDVNNPLLGDKGSTAIYARQKGVLPGDLELLESNLTHFANKLEAYTSRRLRDVEGSGAAGGVVFGLSSVCEVKLSRGAQRVLELLGAREKILATSLVITGEGSLDSQSSFGKAPISIARLASSLGRPTIAVAGTLGEGYLELREHISAAFSIVNRPMPLDEAMCRADSLLEDFGLELGSFLGVLSLS